MKEIINYWWNKKYKDEYLYHPTKIAALYASIILDDRDFARDLYMKACEHTLLDIYLERVLAYLSGCTRMKDGNRFAPPFDRYDDWSPREKAYYINKAVYSRDTLVREGDIIAPPGQTIWMNKDGYGVMRCLAGARAMGKKGCGYPKDPADVITAGEYAKKLDGDYVFVKTSLCGTVMFAPLSPDTLFYNAYDGGQFQSVKIVDVPDDKYGIALSHHNPFFVYKKGEEIVHQREDYMSDKKKGIYWLHKIPAGKTAHSFYSNS